MRGKIAKLIRASKLHKVNLPRPVLAAPKLDFGVIVTTGHRKFPFMENTRNKRAECKSITALGLRE